MNAIKKGMDPKGVGLGAVVLAGGIALVLLGALSSYTLAIGRLALPHWTIYVAGALAVGVGALLAAISFRAAKCAACNRALEHAEAFFPLDAEPHVVSALQRLDTATLSQTPMAAADQPRLVVALDFCDQCRQVAELSLSRSTDEGEVELIAPCVLTGPGIDALAEVAETHAAARGDD